MSLTLEVMEWGKPSHIFEPGPMWLEHCCLHMHHLHARMCL